MPGDIMNQGWLAVDELVEAFEHAWAEDTPAEIFDFLPTADHTQFQDTLLELIRVDLELRWQHGCPISLDDYRIRFPQLSTDPESFSLIAFEEFRARRNSGQSVMPAEYERRFGILVGNWPVIPVKMANSESLGSNHRSSRNLSQDEFDCPRVDSFPEVGTELLSFSLLCELGRGAFSRVFLARQGDLANRLVVLKISAESFAEADKIAQLQHANIVPIYSVHEVGQLSAVCMPYFGSATLADVAIEIRGLKSLPQSGRAIVTTLTRCVHRIDGSSHQTTLKRDASENHKSLDSSESNPLKATNDEERLKVLSSSSYVEAVLRIGAKLADGLKHAHERGILHRDLKPANVLLADDGQPMMLDFNLSEDLKESCRDRESLVGGTMPYMAPEQIYAFQHRTQSSDARSDLYSLGVILFELLAGQYPYPIREGFSLEETLANMLDDRQQSPPGVRAINSDVSPAVEAIVHKCLKADPSRRYQSAAELQDDIERHLKQLPLRHAHEPSVRERTGKWVRRHSRLTSIIGIASLVIGMSFAIEMHQKRLHLSAVEAEVRDLMQAGQEALDNDDADVAYGRFREAWMKVQAEPSLMDYQLGVSGWLDHSRMAVIQRQWRQRVPPREFDDRRDEALLLSLLLDQSDDQISTARNAILAANNLTVPADPGWTLEREKLALVQADLIELESGTEKALNYLDASNEFSSRLFHERRAECLTRLGRLVEAEQAKHKAEQFPTDESSDDLLKGISRTRRRECDQALRNFEHVLDVMPESFIARLLQAICFLQLERPSEARVALTACIAQRPSFMWSYLFRSQASDALGDEKSAIVDLKRVLEGKPSEVLGNAALAKLELVRSK